MKQALQALLLRLRILAGRLDPVSQGWAVMSVGNVTRLAFGLLASVVIARGLGPAAFGVYAVLGAAAGIAGVVADFGLSTAAVSRVAAVWRQRPELGDLATPASGQAAVYRWQAYAWLRLVVTGAVVSLSLLLASFLATRLLDIPRGTGLLQLAFLGVLATAASGAMTAGLQATSHFGRLSVVLIANSALTAVLALVLVAMDRLNLVTALLVLGIGTSLVSLVLGYRLLPPGFRLRWPGLRGLRSEGRSLFRLGAWLWIASIFAVLAAQLDVLLLSRLSTAAAVGIYALALNLASKVDVVNQSLHSVLLPTVSGLADRRILRRYVRSSLTRSALIGVALLALIPLARPLILLLYGPDYTASIGLFRFLVLVSIFDVVTTPLLLLVFPLNRPRLLAAADALRVVVLTAVALLLIPTLGPMGAVAARGAARVAGAAWVVRALLRGPALGDGET